MPDFFCSKKNDTANVLGESFPMKMKQRRF